MNSNTQKKAFLTGNEAIAEAAAQIDFHLMGFYPITPSTEIAEILDKKKAAGEIQTVLLPADGEHGAVGACFGGTTGGARVLNATSSNGLMYSLEQLPVQSGCRLPMVLNLVTRSISGPLDIRCDHSDLSFALLTGWIVLCASNAQAAYDLNIIGLKLGEREDVRLPVIIVTDGFFTSHERQSLEIFESKESVQKFLGKRVDPYTSLDPRNPVTFGPYMNDPDLINNKYQLHKAHQAALKAFPEIAKEYSNLTGRYYPLVESTQMQDAKVGLFLLNTAAETSKGAIEQKRREGNKVGVIRPNLLRPFPGEEIARQCEAASTLVIGDRADIPGSQAGPMGLEVTHALVQNGRKDIQLIHRIYGIGGKIFTEEDALHLIDLGLGESSSSSSNKDFDFLGTRFEKEETTPPTVSQPLTSEQVNTGLIQVSEKNETDGVYPVVQVAHPSELTRKAKRITSGHGACPGCGIFSGLDQFFKGIEGDVVVLYHTGCAMVVTTGYPFSSHRVTYIHNLFQNGAPTLSGLVEVFHEKKRRGEIQTSEEITFVMVTGDGGMDIGMGPTIGTALRNHGMIILEYDNQGYMNTGGQLSYSTPQGHQTSTSHSGVFQRGKAFPHKDTVQIMAATGISYCFSAIENTDTDLVQKAAKAQWYAKRGHLAFGKILVTCPLNWKSEERLGQTILQAAADCCFFPIYEIEQGHTKINYDPETQGRKIPVKDWLKMLGKAKHLIAPENQKELDQIQAQIDRRWQRIRALSEHPLL